MVNIFMFFFRELWMSTTLEDWRSIKDRGRYRYNFWSAINPSNVVLFPETEIERINLRILRCKNFVFFVWLILCIKVNTIKLLTITLINNYDSLLKISFLFIYKCIAYEKIKIKRIIVYLKWHTTSNLNGEYRPYHHVLLMFI